ncbi:hypothetical protein QRX50_43345 [Amycolatopsis carbonis]|uniref:Uncharacterized protein n=1 Tax=Amycolatopsis carbonis TaxID=715471 RepID=A0A9Y2IGX9_9PSEU|nr:hypothetical protein [Amycolatopsis sp. 2-15]WIX78148.1 hypothetical protein QRX50_43345 [Amycolatopsis sp. 2-15]
MANPYAFSMSPDRWVPPDLVGRIRAISIRWGSISITLGLLLIIAIPIFGYSLPTFYDPSTVLTVGLGVISACCLVISGIGLIVARSYVSTGYLKQRKEYTAIGVQLGTLIPAWLATIVFVPWYALSVTTSGNYSDQEQLHFTATIVLYILLPVIAALGVTINLAIAYFLFFSSRHRSQFRSAPQA